MAISAALKFGDNDSGMYNQEYPVFSFRSHYLRNHNGVRPDASYRCDCVRVTMPAPPKSDIRLYEWFADKSMLSGCIERVDNSLDGGEAVSTLKFENARCFSLEEEYDADNFRREVLAIEFVAEEISECDVVFHRE